jgi:hypothetical protein
MATVDISGVSNTSVLTLNPITVVGSPVETHTARCFFYVLCQDEKPGIAFTFLPEATKNKSEKLYEGK